jgi:hypothetical protein
VRLLILALCCTACVERPFDAPLPQPKRAVVDRASLKDILVPAPSDATLVGAVFGGSAELTGWKMEPPQLIPGQRQRMTFYWRCRAEMEPWHIFVHLEDAAGASERIHAEHDPALGRFPTDAWRPGDTIADSFYFVAGKDPLVLFVGFYSQGEARLPITGPGRGRDDGTSRLMAGVLQIAH